MNLTANFPLKDFTKSDTAIRLGIKNEPTPEHLASLKRLCEKVLQPARDALGPITVNSGYRSKTLNDHVGGSKTSQHSKGEAADVESPEKGNLALAQWIANNCVFDQLILEGHDPKKGPDSGWVHVSLRAADNRGEMMTCQFVKGKDPIYRPANFKTK